MNGIRLKEEAGFLGNHYQRRASLFDAEKVTEVRTAKGGGLLYHESKEGLITSSLNIRPLQLVGSGSL